MTFGDHDPDDSFDPTAPLDAGQLARQVWELERVHVGDRALWDTVPEPKRAAMVAVAVALIAWLHRSGHLRG
jgi:hypothetical protein